MFSSIPGIKFRRSENTLYPPKKTYMRPFKDDGRGKKGRENKKKTHLETNRGKGLKDIELGGMVRKEQKICGVQFSNND